MSEHINHTNKLWKDVERGYHKNASGKRVLVSKISTNYAKLLTKWYSNIPLSEEDMDRLKASKMFRDLEEISNNNIGDDKL